MWIARHYNRLIEHFVPDAMRGDREAADQARMFLISHTLGPVIGNSVPLALYLFDPTPTYHIAILLLAITSFWVFPFLLKAGFKYDLLVQSSVLVLNFCIFWSCWFNGGVHSPTLSWILVIPLLSFFYIGGNKAMFRPLLLTFFVCGFLFFGLYSLFGGGRNDIPEAANRALALVSTVAALLYVALMAIYYARVFDRSIELEAEVRRRRRLSRELRAAVGKSNEASHAKAQFLARMSHELRTPLNAVIGYSEIMQEEMEEDGRTEMLEEVGRINSAGKYLLRLINSILDISKIDAGRMQFDVGTHDLRALVHDVVEPLRAEAEDNGNRIETAFQPQPCTIETDGRKLASVLHAVLGNAVRYTRNGDVRVRVLHETIRQTPFIRFEIEDDGCGIASNDLATLFELHGDNRDAAQSQYGGTGMSLIVSRRMIRSMGGEIEVRSRVGAGSIFSVLAPLKWSDPKRTTAGAWDPVPSPPIRPALGLSPA